MLNLQEIDRLIKETASELEVAKRYIERADYALTAVRNLVKEMQEQDSRPLPLPNPESYPAEEVSVNEPPTEPLSFPELLSALQGDIERYNSTHITGRLYMSEPDWVVQNVTFFYRYTEPECAYSSKLFEVQNRPEQNQAVYIRKRRERGEYTGKDYEFFERMVDSLKP